MHQIAYGIPKIFRGDTPDLVPDWESAKVATLYERHLKVKLNYTILQI